MPESTNTKHVLAQALKTLMAERPFEKISVGEICAQCGMNRKSFYYHFKDKYDLVNWIFYHEYIAQVRERRFPDVWALLRDVCAYFYDNRAFYVRAFAIEGQNSFSEYFDAAAGSVVRYYFRGDFEENGDTEYYVEFFADAFRLAIIRWLRERPALSPDKIVSLFQRAAAGVAKKVAGKAAPAPDANNAAAAGIH